MIIDNKLFDELLEKATTNIRRRVNLDLRNSNSDTSQRMLNAILPDSFIDIHRHLNTSETVLLLRGSITEIFYDDQGAECARYDLSIASGVVGLQVPAGQWHTLICHEPSVILEVKDGRYEPLQGTDVWTKG